MTFLYLPRQREMSDWVVLPENSPKMGYFVLGCRNCMECFVQDGKSGMGHFVRITEIAWDVLLSETEKSWDVM